MLKTEFIPAVQTGSTNLLIALHGLGDSLEGFRWLPKALGLDWMNYLLVSAPDPYHGGFSWYEYGGNPDPGVRRSRQELFNLLDAQNASGFPSSKTILSGFSQGCLMTVDVGLRYPRVFAGLIGISGYVHEPETALRELSLVAKQQRFLVTHGFHDPIIPFESAKSQFLQLQGAGINIEWREFQKAHNIAGEVELSVIREFIKAGYPKP